MSRTARIDSRILLAALVVVLPLCAAARAADDGRFVLRREGWSFDRSTLQWYSWAKQEEQKAKGTLNSVNGWTEYDFSVPRDGWYELILTGGVSGWSRDVFVDGKMLFLLTVSHADDMLDKKTHTYKEANLFLDAGGHTLRLRRLGFPGVLPSAWELRASGDDPAGCVRAAIPGRNVVRAREKVRVILTGGTNRPTEYALLLRDQSSGETVPAGTVSFPASKRPLERTLDVAVPRQGVFDLLAAADGKLLRPADLKAGALVAIDTVAPPPGGELRTTTVVDIDCAGERGTGFREKDGATRVVKAPFGSYRESSGKGTAPQWATDGFSYAFDLPDADHLYRLTVDYPDDDRRTMGFWINDGALSNDGGVILTGGVETGDRYRLTNRMQTHRAFFRPINEKGLVVAVINLTRGCRAAAARIRIDRIDSPLPAGPTGRAGGRTFGNYFEESGRWLRHFGARRGEGLGQHLATMERWGEWNRFMGANLMFPTINVYQGNYYPSRILDGYFSQTYDACRMNALMAEKYGSRYVPEFHLSGQPWFDRHVMGAWTEEREENGKKVAALRTASPAVEEYIIRNRDGATAFGWKAFGYNALHPKVQEMYISVIGELADRLGDSPAFAGVSSRLMLGWQWQGWNALPGLYWGYDDWTVAQFSKETGVAVPGAAGDPRRFRVRYDYLCGPRREEWTAWRCAKIFDYHKRLRDRIRRARPDARLFLTYHGPDERETPGRTTLERMREIGMDWRLYANEPGIVIVPGVMYGRRFSTPLADAEAVSGLFSEDVKTVARLGDRGFQLYSAYFEVNDNLDWTALGGKKYVAFDACAPSGDHEREMYAIALADSDTSFLSNGGNGWIFGTPETMRPFLAEYRALPALPFTPLESGRDPVAVWYRQAPDGFWFYAVNRLPTPSAATLSLAGASSVKSAATGAAVAPGPGGTLRVELEPYMLKAFRADGRSVRLTGCRAERSPAEEKVLAPMVSFARTLRSEIAARRTAVELSEEQARRALELLDGSAAAFAEGRYWTARANLERTEMIRVYDMIGRYPPGLHERKAPRDFSPLPDAPKLAFEGERSLVGDARGRLPSVRDFSFDRDGNIVAASPSHVMVFDPAGRYLRSLRFVMAHTPDSADIRWGGLTPPPYQSATALRALPDGRIAVFAYNSPLNLYEPALGRLAAAGGDGSFPLPPGNHWQMAADRAGNLYVGATGGATSVGVWKFRPDGAPAYEFAAGTTNRLCADNPNGIALDAAGNVFVAAADGKIRAYRPDGATAAEWASGIPQGPGRIAVAPDGSAVFAAVPRAGALVCFRRGPDGTYARAWEETRLGAPVSALALSPAGALVLGFERPSAGSVLREYAVGEKGVSPARDLVADLAAASPRPLLGRTQLRKRGGVLYFLADNRLMRLTPGETDTVEEVYDTGVREYAVDSFAFAPDGGLYLASNFGFFGNTRGMNVYLAKKTADGWEKPVMLNDGRPLVDNWSFTPTDLAVDGQGRLILRLADPDPAQKTGGPTVSIFRTAPGREPERMIALGGTTGWGDYGLHLDDAGTLYVAGGGTRAVAAVSPEGSTLWETRFSKEQGPGSVPMRQPLGIATDSRGLVWTTDPAGNRILCFDGKGRFLASFGRFGTVDDRSGEGLCMPVGIAAVADAAGREWLYVADTGNQRIVKYLIAR